MENQNTDPTKIIIPDSVKHLIDIERTPEQEKELEEALFGKGQILPVLVYKWFVFSSLSKIKDICVPSLNIVNKEWVGETNDGKVVIIKYSNLEQITNTKIDLGVGASEIRARFDIKNIASSKLPDFGMNVEKLNQQLKLEWVLPSFYIDE